MGEGKGRTNRGRKKQRDREEPERKEKKEKEKAGDIGGRKIEGKGEDQGLRGREKAYEKEKVEM